MGRFGTRSRDFHTVTMRRGSFSWSILSWLCFRSKVPRRRLLHRPVHRLVHGWMDAWHGAVENQQVWEQASRTVYRVENKQNYLRENLFGIINYTFQSAIEELIRPGDTILSGLREVNRKKRNIFIFATYHNCV